MLNYHIQTFIRVQNSPRLATTLGKTGKLILIVKIDFSFFIVYFGSDIVGEMVKTVQIVSSLHKFSKICTINGHSTLQFVI